MVFVLPKQIQFNIQDSLVTVYIFLNIKKINFINHFSDIFVGFLKSIQIIALNNINLFSS